MCTNWLNRIEIRDENFIRQPPNNFKKYDNCTCFVYSDLRSNLPTAFAFKIQF